ncbi:peptidase, S9A/B/C family, catalytic domain protein [Pseudoflavonifractor capillosus ATCC 29799]|uniref:Peptidase, S9A/B/C family, catalytic domain protein n=1 Tax=Pseudoflavonifractor capillosus ATCC 29799 TaxID=411467 RepID=A6NZV8_9FIRM|nr:S9 family peptidase [Pseudoflavonifractor capillosus]EDM98461.1 peptidase, S9A/B/C family, catalytic domain protein [Pseudoflavonifractor capillosus ATCC 29799]
MKPLELKDFLQYRYLSGLTWAPGGGAAAFLVKEANLDKNGYDTHIWIHRGGKQTQLTAAGDETGLCWEDGKHILFPDLRTDADKKRRADGEQFTVFYRIGIDGGEALRAFELPFAVTELAVADENYFVAMGKIDVNCPDYYAMTDQARRETEKYWKEESDFQVIDELPFRFNGMGYINKVRNAIFLVNRKTLEVRRLSAANEEVNAWTMVDGKVCYCAEAIETKMLYRQKIYVCDPAQGEAVCKYGGAEYQIEYMVGYKGKVVFAGGTQERYGYNENPMFYQMDLDTGAVTLFSDNPDSLHPAIGSDCRLGRTRLAKVCGDEIYYLATIRNSVWLMKMDGSGARTPVIREEGSVDDFDLCEEEGDILAVCLYDGTLQDLYAFDKNGEKRRKVSGLNTAILKGKYVAECERVSFQFQDYDLDGWVLKPMGYDPNKSYPGILDIHGGPKVAFGETFYHEMQAWASRGYFVFFCNPVGSDGRGNDFMFMRGKYATVDYDSLMTFVDTVLEKYPQIDQSRLAVTGGSYGGYMTNWIITHNHRFACAASQRSISNWLSFYGYSDLGYNFNVDQMNTTIFEGADKMWNVSPMKYAANIQTPTLFIHSDEDYRCPLSEGLQIYTSMVDRGIPTRMCIFKGENHELSRSGRPKHRMRRLNEITAWIEKYTK